jgi:hypothetical protein
LKWGSADKLWQLADNRPACHDPKVYTEEGETVLLTDLTELVILFIFYWFSPPDFVK